MHFSIMAWLVELIMMIIIPVRETCSLPVLWACQWLPSARWFKESWPCVSHSFTKIHKERSLSLPCLWHPFTQSHCPLLFTRLSHHCLSPGRKVGRFKKLGARSHSLAEIWHHLSGRQWGPQEGNWDPDHSESNKIFLWGETRSEDLLAYKPSVCKILLQLFPWWFLLLLTSHQAITDQNHNHKCSPNSSWQCLNWDWQQMIFKPAKRYKNLTNTLLGGMGLCLRPQPAMKHCSCTACRAKCGETHGQVLLSGPPPVQSKHRGSSCLLTIVLLFFISLKDGVTANLCILPLAVPWQRLQDVIPTPGDWAGPPFPWKDC